MMTPSCQYLCTIVSKLLVSLRRCRGVSSTRAPIWCTPIVGTWRGAWQTCTVGSRGRTSFTLSIPGCNTSTPLSTAFPATPSASVKVPATYRQKLLAKAEELATSSVENLMTCSRSHDVANMEKPYWQCCNTNNTGRLMSAGDTCRTTCLKQLAG